jgi:D-3-phosphoglycerate dehydrogenase
MSFNHFVATAASAAAQVGGEVARRARGLGMHVVAYDPYASEEKARAAGVTLVTLDEALATGDFFSLHMPLTPGTKNMFNDEAFAKMKKGARIMNVARGGVIDDEALARALDSGKVAAAALDVFTEEPPKFEGHPLIGRCGRVGGRVCVGAGT